MPDQLVLSYWLRGHDEGAVLRHFEKLLRIFPFSTARPGISSLRIYALEEAEPPLVETPFDPEADVETVIRTAEEFRNADCGYLAGGHWDLWQLQGNWELLPSPVLLSCYGPLFQNGLGDHLRVELGDDSHFLPKNEGMSAAKIRSNIQGLLRLARELDQVLPVEKRSLWAESGENFAAKLETELGRTRG